MADDMTMLSVRHSVPSGLLDAQPEQLLELLGGPTLIHLSGAREPALFVSVLLHGNETTGFVAIQRLLQRYGGDRPELPRSLSLLIGNVAAAAQRCRRLVDQPDYNRVWPGTEHGPCEEAVMLRAVVEDMRACGVFASIDVHNNTGLNPHYACINRLDHGFFHLATLFGRTVVYFVRPRGVQSAAFAEFCPAVTLECGKVGQEHGIEHAVTMLDAGLHLQQIPETPIHPQDIDLFHTVATVKVCKSTQFSFGTEDVELRLAPDLDRFNFRELPSGTVMGWSDKDVGALLSVQDEAGREVVLRYFEQVEGELRTRLPVTPSMFTLDTRIIRQDCLGYFMERLPIASVCHTLS